MRTRVDFITDAMSIFDAIAETVVCEFASTPQPIIIGQERILGRIEAPARHGCDTGISNALSLLLLGALNAFKLNFLQPRTIGQIQFFTALFVLVFLLFVILLLLLLRNILKHLADQRSRALGSRLRSRMLIGAVLISFAPALFMFLFSYWLLNRSIDRWFTQPVSELRENSTRIALDLANYVGVNARAEAESLARSESFTQNFREANASGMLDEIRMHRITLQGGFTIIYRDGVPVTQYQLPQSTQPATVRGSLTTKTTVRLRRRNRSPPPFFEPHSAATSQSSLSATPSMLWLTRLCLKAAWSWLDCRACRPERDGAADSRGSKPVLGTLPRTQKHSQHLSFIAVAAYSSGLFFEQLARAVSVQASDSPC